MSNKDAGHDKDSNADKSFEPITLSSALLAPVNSIFEAQIHAARAFLNFILQMGFRHKYDVELDELDDDKIEKNEKARREGKKRMRELFDKKKDQGLSRKETNELRELSCKHGDLFQQMVEYVDDTGNQFVINIPNLALLPIKPLAITEGDFSYEFEVQSQNHDYKQMGAAYNKSPDEEGKRPWFLINEPKSIRGSFATRKEESSERSIKINVKVGNTEMPYGLEKLLTHLTNNMDAIDREDGTVAP
ncbi:DUF2589 domain-containing protein [Fulvivirga sp. RKSG066]|uniref:DUF2589 domain-containing protein n=1 Tax=Fulvivirga aurantia TaxID=2529383 RepID=UPI0012BBBDAE|nr:DUF2589 domain-containing protein [Fulvivirga aurantia]MTI23163.1 DUF2589 domain-containing protein [Fulvivirga aurantia]